MELEFPKCELGRDCDGNKEAGVAVYFGESWWHICWACLNDLDAKGIAHSQPLDLVPMPPTPCRKCGKTIGLEQYTSREYDGRVILANPRVCRGCGVKRILEMCFDPNYDPEKDV